MNIDLARRCDLHGDKMADVLACLKRSVVLLIGQHAVYLRLPSQDPEGKVHRIKVDDLHQDLLAEKDKPLYSKYKHAAVRPRNMQVHLYIYMYT